MTEQKICVACGAVLRRKPGDGPRNWNRKRFCSLVCRYRRKNGRSVPMPETGNAAYRHVTLPYVSCLDDGAFTYPMRHPDLSMFSEEFEHEPGA